MTSFDPSSIVFPELPAGFYWQVNSERSTLEITVEETIENPYTPNWFMRVVVGYSAQQPWRVIAKETLYSAEITPEGVAQAVQRVYLQATLHANFNRETK